MNKLSIKCCECSRGGGEEGESGIFTPETGGREQTRSVDSNRDIVNNMTIVEAFITDCKVHELFDILSN